MRNAVVFRNEEKGMTHRNPGFPGSSSKVWVRFNKSMIFETTFSSDAQLTPRSPMKCLQSRKNLLRVCSKSLCASLSRTYFSVSPGRVAQKQISASMSATSNHFDLLENSTISFRQHGRSIGVCYLCHPPMCRGI